MKRNMKNEITLFTIFLIIVTTFNPLFSQIQVGADIDGEAADDQSGFSVSLSSGGSRVAIGAPFNDGNGAFAGHVRIYEWIGGSWAQVGADIDGEVPGDQSGVSISLSLDGNRIAIGAPFNDGNGDNAGHVRIYEWIGGSWTQVGAVIDGEAPGDISGVSVSLSSNGSRVAIGAQRNDGNGDNAGHVRVYDWIAGNWTQVGEDIDGETEGDRTGYSVSLSSNGSRVAIGAIRNDGNGDNAGHVRIYEWIGGSWTQVGADIDGEAPEDISGVSVSLSSNGNRVAIGARGNDGNGDNAGHVRVYDWIAGNWTQVGEDIDGEEAGDLSGGSISLSLDGNRLAIGAHYNDDKTGHVRVYDWDEDNWTQVGIDINGEEVDDQSGYSISLASDGSKLAIGAWFNNGNGIRSGHVRVYEFTSVSTISPNVKAVIEVNPNPTMGKIELVGVENGMIKIIDIFGKVILKVEKSKSEIDISWLPSGIYFIQISSDNQLITKTIIKN
jgi:Secretion system C-terminal sorting domain